MGRRLVRDELAAGEEIRNNRILAGERTHQIDPLEQDNLIGRSQRAARFNRDCGRGRGSVVSKVQVAGQVTRIGASMQFAHQQVSQVEHIAGGGVVEVGDRVSG